MTSLRQDVLYAYRTWLKSPGMVAVAVLSLALGIGANTTIYSVLNSIRYYELPFEDPDRLVVIWATNLERGITQSVPPFETVSALAKNSQAFQKIGFFGGGTEPVTLSGIGETRRVPSQPVDVNIFSVLGVKPLLGRDYRPDDVNDFIKQKEVRSIVISHDTWQRNFGGDQDVIGQTLKVDGLPRTVIGVMPPGFSIVPWMEEMAYWAANDLSRIPKARWMLALGRLKPGVSIEQAQAETEAISRQVLESQGEDVSGWSSRLETLHEAYFGGVEAAMLFLLGAVGFVLLIACANVANLLLARGAIREKELTIRASLGAGRARLVRQLLTESVLLALLGGALGSVVAIWGNQIFASLVPQELPDLLKDIYIDERVLLFTLGLSVITGLLFGLLPALQVSKVDLNEALKEGGRSLGGVQGRGRGLLLVSEVALAMILLIGAGLMMRGFLKEQNADPGFDTENLLTADILLGGSKYFEKIPGDMNRVTPQCTLFYDQVLEQINSLPGVKSAGLISRLPFGVWSQPFTILGRPAPEPGREPTADFNEVDSKLFQTLEVPLLRGRYIGEQDVEGGPWVAVINKTFAERYFPDEDPIGQAIQVTIWARAGGIRVKEDQVREIVGVVGDLKYPSFFEEQPAAMYVSHRQHPWEYGGGDHWVHIRKMLVVRGHIEPMTLASPVREAVEDVDPDQTAHDLMTMKQRFSGSPSVVQSRFLAQLFGTFGGLAIFLAAVGIYGVMAYFVSQRSNEFGLRMALGATKIDLIKLLLRQALKPTLVGVAVGVTGGLGLSALLNSVFWNLSTIDPVAFGGVTLLMVGAALLAAYVPARRATRVDPLEALRYQ